MQWYPLRATQACPHQGHLFLWCPTMCWPTGSPSRPLFRTSTSTLRVGASLPPPLSKQYPPACPCAERGTLEWKVRLPLLRQELERYNADIFCLQECDLVGLPPRGRLISQSCHGVWWWWWGGGCRLSSATISEPTLRSVAMTHSCRSGYSHVSRPVPLSTVRCSSIRTTGAGRRSSQPATPHCGGAPSSPASGTRAGRAPSVLPSGGMSSSARKPLPQPLPPPLPPQRHPLL